MRSRTIDLDGPVHVVDFGGTGPAMVLVHGLGGSHVNWMAVGARLAERARVIALDFPGFGRTPLAGRSASIAANQAMLDRFLDTVVEEPAILVGNSMGGLISLLQAADAPAKVRGLVLVAPAQPRPAGSRPDLLVAATFAAYALPGVGERVLGWRAARLGPEGLVRATLQLCCGDPGLVSADVVAAHVALARDRIAGMPWAHGAFLEASRSLLLVLFRAGRFRAAVRRITAPTLIVQGTRDRLVPVAASQALAALRPDWSLVLLDGVGHVPQLEVADRFVATLTSWLDRAAPDEVASALP